MRVCRVINGERGSRGGVKVDDTSATIEATVDDTMLLSHGALLQDDTLLIVSGKYQPARGGFDARFAVKEIWDLAAARCRYGRYLKVAVNTATTPIGAAVSALVREFPAKREVSEQGEQVRGLGVRLVVQCRVDGAQAADAAATCSGATAELHLGDAARFYPTDAALAGWRLQADQGRSTIAYE